MLSAKPEKIPTKQFNMKLLEQTLRKQKKEFRRLLATMNFENLATVFNLRTSHHSQWLVGECIPKLF